MWLRPREPACSERRRSRARLPLRGSSGVTGASGLLGAPSAVAPLVASHNQDAFGAHDSQVGMGAVASGVSSLEQRGLEIRLDGESLPNAVAKGLSEAEAAAAAASDGGGSSLGTTMQTFRHTPRTAARIRPRGYARSSASGADQDQQLALRGDPASSSHDAQLLSPESYLSHSHRRLVIDPNPRSRHGTDKHTGTAAVTTHDSRQTPAKPSRLFDGRSPFTPGSAHRSDARTPEHTPSLHAGASAAGSSSMHKPTPKKTPGQFTPGFSRAQDDDIDEWQPPPPQSTSTTRTSRAMRCARTTATASTTRTDAPWAMSTTTLARLLLP